MLRIVALVYLTLWTTAVRAFYPYFPAYLCSDDDVCVKGEKRSVPGLLRPPPEESSEHLTFPLSRRKPDGKLPSPAAAAREADRLRRKHAPAQPSRVARGEEGLGKRDNKYSIATAAAPTMTNSAGVDQDGTDFSYFIQAGFGSTQKPLYMLLDTGAGTTWVMGSDCTSSACGLHNEYGPGDSKSYKSTGKPFSIAYGTGTVAGTQGQDSIAVADMTVTMAFGVANTTSNDFTYFPFDGILGLSMSKGATDNFMQAVQADSLLKANIFSVSLGRASDGSNTGEITFGATDSAKFTGDIGYTPVSSEAGGEWAIPLDDLSFDGKKAGLPARLAYIDTGTSYVFGPGDDVAALHKAIPGASSTDGQTFTVPCSTKLPVVVSFSGVEYAMSPRDWISAPSGSGVCTSNIYGHEVVTGAWLFGDLFLKNVYSVFDVDQTRIGFAAKPTAATTATTTSSSAAASTQTGTDSTLATLITPSPSATGASTGAGTNSAFPGLSGHETSGTSGTPVAQTASPSATSAQKSPGGQLESSRLVSIVCAVAAVAFMA